MLNKEIEKRINNLNLLKNNEKEIFKAVELIKEAFKNGKKVLFCGNGGSASDSNHLACEFISKFKKIRHSLPSISLSANNSIISAIGNDFSFDDVFLRQVEGLGNVGDVLIGISTSGKSKNILKALETAKNKGLKTIFLTGKNGFYEADCTIQAPSEITAEIQEMHIFIGHFICEMVENNL